MMDEIDDEEFLNVTLGLQFILKGRVDPLFCNLTVNLHPTWIENNSIYDLMEIAEGLLMEELNQRATHTLIFADERNNRHVIVANEIQAVSLLAPDKMPSID